MPYIDFSPALFSIIKIILQQIMRLLHGILITYHTKKQMKDPRMLINTKYHKKNRLKSERHSIVSN